MENNNLSYAIETLTDYFQYMHENISYLNEGHENVEQRLFDVENSNVKIHIVDKLPDTTINNDWIMLVRNNSGYNDFTHYVEGSTEYGVLHELPADATVLNDSEIDENYWDGLRRVYTFVTEYILIDEEHSLAYLADMVIKGKYDLDDEEEESYSGDSDLENEDTNDGTQAAEEEDDYELPFNVDEMTDVLYVIYDKHRVYEDDNDEEGTLVDDGIPIVNTMNEAANAEYFRFILRPNNSVEFAKDGHIYLTRKTTPITVLMYHSLSNHWVEHSGTIIDTTDISNYIIGSIPDIQNSIGEPQVHLNGNSLVAVDDYPFPMNIVNYTDTVNGTHTLYELRGEGLYEITNGYVFCDELPKFDRDTTLWYIKREEEENNIYDEFYFTDGHYERLGDLAIDKNDIENTISELESTMNARINEFLASNRHPTNFDRAMRQAYLKADPDLYYGSYTNLVFTSGYTRTEPQTYNIYYISSDILEYENGDDYEIKYVCLEDPRTTAQTTVTIYTYVEYILETDGRSYAVTLRPSSLYITNIDKGAEQFDIYRKDSYGAVSSYHSDIPFYNSITNDEEMSLVQYVKGRTTDTVVEHNSNPVIKTFLGNKLTQHDINTNIAVGALMFNKSFEIEGYIETAYDHRPSQNKHFVSVYVSSSRFADADGFVIDDTVQALKDEATEIEWSRPRLSDSDGVYDENTGDYTDYPQTTWCYIGSSEPFTGTPDDIQYTFMWEKANPENALLWRNTEIESKDASNDYPYELYGDGVKLEGYKLCENLAGRWFKKILQNLNEPSTPAES